MRVAILALAAASSLAAAPAFQFRLAAGLRAAPVDGRLILVVSRNLQGEPRFQVTYGLPTQQVFGLDVDGWKPGDAVEMRRRPRPQTPSGPR
jgi:hypothetical protein